MEYYILKKDGKVEYQGKEWGNLVAFVSARKSKEGYTLSSLSIQNSRASISHVYDLETFLKPSTKLCSTTVDIPLEDLEMLLNKLGRCICKTSVESAGGASIDG